jgi:hypothetical protein
MTTTTICNEEVVAVHQYPESFAQEPAGATLPDQVREEEWQERLRCAQQWVCELLIKNQQLRMSLESAKARERGDPYGRNV